MDLSRAIADRSKVRARRAGSDRGRARRRLSVAVLPLETRALLTTFYTDDSLVVTIDRDMSGTLSTGDQVTFDFGGPRQQTNLTYNFIPIGGDVGTAFSTMNQTLAFGTVADGDTVQVAPGTYVENVPNFNKRISVIGSGAAATQFIGAAANQNVWIVGSAAPGPVMQFFGFSIRTAPGSTDLFSDGIRLTTGNVFINNVNASNNSGSGISVSPDPVVPTRNINIFGSTLSNNGNTGLRLSYGALNLQVSVVGSTINNNAFNGITVLSDAGRVRDLIVDQTSFSGNSNGQVQPGYGAIGLYSIDGSVSTIQLSNLNIDVTNAQFGIGISGSGGSSAQKVSIFNTTITGASTVGDIVLRELTGPVAPNFLTGVNFNTTSVTGLRVSDTLTGNINLQYTTFGNPSTFITNLSPARFDATGATFNGIAPGFKPSNGTTAQLFQLSDRIYDGVDVDGAGPVILREDNLFVTPQSFFAPLTTAANIQRSVNTADPGTRINIAPGTYNNNLALFKDVALVGPMGNANQVIINPGGGTVVSAGNGAFVRLENLTLTGGTFGIDAFNIGQLSLLNVNVTGNIAPSFVTNGFFFYGGSSGDDFFDVTSFALRYNFQDPINLNGISYLILDGAQGSDTFFVDPTAGRSYLIYGGELPGDDTLLVDALGNPAAVTTAEVIVPGFPTINYSSIANVEVFNRATLPPVANPDAAFVSNKSAVTISVLANDEDPSGGPLTLVSTTPVPSGVGTVFVDQANGTIRFTPKTGFTGLATFSYTVANGFNQTATATVQVNVTAATMVPLTAGYDPATQTLTVYNVSTSSTTVSATIRTVGNLIQVLTGNTLIPVAGGTPFTFNTARIVYAGGNGADIVNLAQLTGLTNPEITINGLGGNDNITGSPFDDLILGGAGVDAIRGRGGNDIIEGGADGDIIFGEDGDDSIIGGDGNDQIQGGLGNDTVQGTFGNDLIYGDAPGLLSGAPGTGNDSLYGGAGNDTVYGNFGDDLLFGDMGNDILFGETGNDILRGLDGNDRLDGGAGNDDLFGGLVASPDDSLFGGLGADFFGLLFGDPLPPGPPASKIKDFNAAQGDTFQFFV